MHESLKKGKQKRSPGQLVVGGAGNLRDEFRGCVEGEDTVKNDWEGDGVLFWISQKPDARMTPPKIPTKSAHTA